MKNHLLSSLLVLLIISSLSSCLKYDEETLPLGAVNLQMTEDLTSESRSLHFNFFTEENYECLNYYINVAGISGSDLIEINLIDVEKDNLCLADSGPAIVSVNLGNLDVGTYPLNIIVGSAVNNGSLLVTEENYVVDFDSPQMLTANYDTLHRIPEDFIWGLVAYHVEESDTIMNAFLDSLEGVGAQPRGLSTGDYGYFQADTTGQIIPPEGIEHNFSKTFAYDYNDAMARIEEVISFYSTYHGNTIFVYLYDSEGQTYLSSDY